MNPLLLGSLLTYLCLVLSSSISAQNKQLTEPTVISISEAQPMLSDALAAPDIKQLHQIYLDRPATKLHQIEYHDGTPLKGRLSPDRMRIYIENYEKRGRIVATLTYKNSKAPEELKRSSCFIDPVPEF